MGARAGNDCLSWGWREKETWGEKKEGRRETKENWTWGRVGKNQTWTRESRDWKIRETKRRWECLPEIWRYWWWEWSITCSIWGWCQKYKNSNQKRRKWWRSLLKISDQGQKSTIITKESSPSWIRLTCGSPSWWRNRRSKSSWRI